MRNAERILIAIITVAWALTSISVLLEFTADGRLRAILNAPWPRATCGIASMAAIFCAGPAMLVALYYMSSMRAEVRPEKRLLVHFVAPVSIFLPQLWTDRGNRYRRLLLLWLAIFSLLFSIPFTCKSFVF